MAPILKGCRLWDIVEEAARRKHQVDHSFNLVEADIDVPKAEEQIMEVWFKIRNNKGDFFVGYVQIEPS